MQCQKQRCIGWRKSTTQHIQQGHMVRNLCSQLKFYSTFTAELTYLSWKYYYENLQIYYWIYYLSWCRSTRDSDEKWTFMTPILIQCFLDAFTSSTRHSKWLKMNHAIGWDEPPSWWKWIPTCTSSVLIYHWQTLCWHRFGYFFSSLKGQ